MEAPDFWDDAEKASADMKELKDLKSIVERADALSMAYDDIMTLIEMGNEEADESLVPEVENEFVQFQKEFEDLRITTMLTGEHDAENAILTLHAGAGGTESCDWASMLCRMYEKWADKRGFSVEVLDSLDGDEAGLKSVTLEIQGDNAYGYLKSEHGVHRLVRISPFNAAGNRLRLCHVTSCRILSRILILKSQMMISELTRTVRAVPVDSISTKRHRQSELPIFQRVLWYNVRMSVHSI